MPTTPHPPPAALQAVAKFGDDIMLGRIDNDPRKLSAKPALARVSLAPYGAGRPSQLTTLQEGEFSGPTSPVALRQAALSQPLPPLPGESAPMAAAPSTAREPGLQGKPWSSKQPGARELGALNRSSMPSISRRNLNVSWGEAPAQGAEPSSPSRMIAAAAGAAAVTLGSSGAPAATLGDAPPPQQQQQQQQVAAGAPARRSGDVVGLPGGSRQGSLNSLRESLDLPAAVRVSLEARLSRAASSSSNILLSTKPSQDLLGLELLRGGSRLGFSTASEDAPGDARLNPAGSRLGLGQRAASEEVAADSGTLGAADRRRSLPVTGAADLLGEEEEEEEAAAAAAHDGGQEQGGATPSSQEQQQGAAAGPQPQAEPSPGAQQQQQQQAGSQQGVQQPQQPQHPAQHVALDLAADGPHLAGSTTAPRRGVLRHAHTYQRRDLPQHPPLQHYRTEGQLFLQEFIPEPLDAAEAGAEDADGAGPQPRRGPLRRTVSQALMAAGGNVRRTGRQALFCGCMPVRVAYNSTRKQMIKRTKTFARWAKAAGTGAESSTGQLRWAQLHGPLGRLALCLACSLAGCWSGQLAACTARARACRRRPDPSPATAHARPAARPPAAPRPGCASCASAPSSRAWTPRSSSGSSAPSGCSRRTSAPRLHRCTAAQLHRCTAAPLHRCSASRRPSARGRSRCTAAQPLTHAPFHPPRLVLLRRRRPAGTCSSRTASQWRSSSSRCGAACRTAGSSTTCPTVRPPRPPACLPGCCTRCCTRLLRRPQGPRCLRSTGVPAAL